MAQKPSDDIDDENDGEFVPVEGSEDRESEPGDKADDVAAQGDDDLVVIMPSEEELAADDADEAKDDKDDKAGGKDDADDTGDEGKDEVDQEADDTDADVQSYSTKVQKRIMRERRITRQANADLQTERAARIAAERQALAANKQMTEIALVNLDATIVSETARLKRAKEEGLTDDEIDAQTKVNDAMSRKREVSAVKDRLEAAEQQAKTVQPGITPEAQAWMSRNKWYKHDQFFAETAAMNSIDQQVKREGYDPATPAYFKRMDELVSTKLPDLRVKRARVFQPRPKGKVQSAVAPVTRAGGVSRQSAAAGKQRVTITKADVETMTQFKLDPKNPEHVKQFAREKLANRSGA